MRLRRFQWLGRSKFNALVRMFVFFSNRADPAPLLLQSITVFPCCEPRCSALRVCATHRGPCHIVRFEEELPGVYRRPGPLLNASAVQGGGAVRRDGKAIQMTRRQVGYDDLLAKNFRTEVIFSHPD